MQLAHDSSYDSSRVWSYRWKSYGLLKMDSRVQLRLLFEGHWAQHSAYYRVPKLALPPVRYLDCRQIVFHDINHFHLWFSLVLAFAMKMLTILLNVDVGSLAFSNSNNANF